MPQTLVVASLAATSGLAEDVVQNSFVINDPVLLPAPGATVDWTGPINTFYNAIGGRYSPKVSRLAGGITYKLYDITGKLAGQPLGSPLATDSGQLTTVAQGSQAMPSEVAVVLTLRASGWDGAQVEVPDDADADLGVERPRSRLSGRLYLGPFNTTVMDSGGDRPDLAVLTAFRNAYQSMKTSFATTNKQLRVWSRQNASTIAVVAVQTDNAFDTQRRRGVDPTARVTLPLT